MLQNLANTLKYECDVQLGQCRKNKYRETQKRWSPMYFKIVYFTFCFSVLNRVGDLCKQIPKDPRPFSFK